MVRVLIARATPAASPTALPSQCRVGTPALECVPIRDGITLEPYGPR
jgi:hypothetical protein